MISARDIPKNIAGPTPRGPKQPEPREPEPESEFIPVGMNGILASAEKLLAINRGLEEPDDRDSYGFKHIFSVDKHMGERIDMDAGRLRRSLVRHAAKSRTLKGAYPFVFDPYATGLLLGDPNAANPLSAPLEEINPLHILESARRITQMGPGGIGSDMAISAEAQNINNSQFGFVSVLEGPECSSSDTEVLTSRGWVFWPEIADDDLFACRVEDATVFCAADRIIREPYRGKMIIVDSPAVEFMVTPSHRLWIHPRMQMSPGHFFCSADDAAGEEIEIPGEKFDRVVIQRADWRFAHYDGVVYCATVPGGLLLTRRNGKPGTWSGNSSRAGIDARLAMGVRIGSDGRLYQQFRNRRTKELEWLSPEDVETKIVAMPE